MENFLYEQVAGKLETLIRKGVYKTGDKLVSVRGLSEEQGISLSTAFKAYSELEQKGLIEARTKSGYYVRYTPRVVPSTPGRPEDGRWQENGRRPDGVRRPEDGQSPEEGRWSNGERRPEDG